MARLFGDAYACVSDPWLRRACYLAERGRGTTSPNPPVGCVLVRDDTMIAEGFHVRAGEPHAEALALAKAGTAARGATAYVTLEPCAHQGRTPPCAAALLAAGVDRVVVGVQDPTHLGGGGAEILRRGGVEVVFADDDEPFGELLLEWTHAQTTGRPFVRVKTALTLDGHASLRAGTPSRLTGRESARLTMRLRAGADAVLVGTGTMDADDPSLTVRDADDAPVPLQPLRVVLSDGALPAVGSRMLHDGLGPVALLVPNAAGADASVGTEYGDASVIGYSADEGIEGAMRALHTKGVVSLLVEAGPRLLTALYAHDLIDELVLYHAGGMAGLSAPPLFVKDDARDDFDRRLAVVETGMAGEDAVTVWRPPVRA